MKAVVYHYVRPRDPGLPHLRHLDPDGFRRQLDDFAAGEGFVSREDFERAIETGEVPERGFVLTFDDGLGDHYLHVAPELASRGLWGIFFVSTGPLRTPRLLDVHRVHILLGRFGGPAMLSALDRVLGAGRIEAARRALPPDHVYLRQPGNDVETVLFKWIVNYELADGERTAALDRLMELHLDEAAEHEAFYMSGAMLREMAAMGMMIGGHAITHRALAKLDPREQRREVEQCFADLEAAVASAQSRIFSYPFGIEGTFDAVTVGILRECACRCAFAVNAGPITAADIRDRRFALPRIDCNRFPTR